MKRVLIAAVMAMTACVAIAMDSRVPPLFTGSVMTNETVLFMGTDDAAPLMYKADEILSVTSFDLKTNYVEGVDWTFDRESHTIRPTANTRMPYYTDPRRVTIPPRSPRRFRRSRRARAAEKLCSTATRSRQAGTRPARSASSRASRAGRSRYTPASSRRRATRASRT